jgi:hypothetical protein
MSSPQKQTKDNSNHVSIVKIPDHLGGKPFPTIQATDEQKRNFRDYFIAKTNKK